MTRPRHVQLRNPRSDRYVKVDRERGVIVAHKGSRGPFKRVAHARRRPYTVIGIRRVTCAYRGCRRKGYASWQICADGRVFRVLCFIHDIALNRLVLEWVGDRNVERKLAKYAAAVIRKVNAGAGS